MAKPLVGEPALASVDNRIAKDLLPSSAKQNWRPKTIVEIVGVLKEVVASAINGEGKTNVSPTVEHEYIDLRWFDPKKQHRPTLNSMRVSDVITRSAGRYQALYAFASRYGSSNRRGTCYQAGSVLRKTTPPSHPTARQSTFQEHLERPRTKAQDGERPFAPRYSGDSRGIPEIVRWRSDIRFMSQTDRGLSLGQSNILEIRSIS